MHVLDVMFIFFVVWTAVFSQVGTTCAQLVFMPSWDLNLTKDSLCFERGTKKNPCPQLLTVTAYL